MIDTKVETLLAVAEKMNFTQAARELSLTQPAVSHHIGKLEEEIGAKLFLRGKGELRLTFEGELAVKCARRMKAMYEKLMTDVANAEKNMTRLRIGITHTAESNVVAEVLARYSNENPGIAITIATEPIKILYDMMENYELDLAIVEGKPHAEHLSSLMLGTDYLVCVMAPHHPLARQAMVTLDEIKREKLILRLPNSETRILFLNHLASSNQSFDNFNVILEVDNIATIKDLIRKDLGISILAQSACMDEMSKGKIVALPIENMSMIRETNLVYHRDFTYHEILQGIVDLYKKTVNHT